VLIKARGNRHLAVIDKMPVLLFDGVARRFQSLKAACWMLRTALFFGLSVSALDG
jgi:hypothetical protein